MLYAFAYLLTISNGNCVYCHFIRTFCSFLKSRWYKFSRGWKMFPVLLRHSPKMVNGQTSHYFFQKSKRVNLPAHMARPSQIVISFYFNHTIPTVKMYTVCRSFVTYFIVLLEKSTFFTTKHCSFTNIYLYPVIYEYITNESIYFYT